MYVHFFLRDDRIEPIELEYRKRARSTEKKVLEPSFSSEKDGATPK